MNQIRKEHLARAFDVNDAFVQEHRRSRNEYDPDSLMDLGVNIDELAQFGAEYVLPRVKDAEKDVPSALCLTFSMGAVTALRARKLADGD